MKKITLYRLIFIVSLSAFFLSTGCNQKIANTVPGIDKYDKPEQAALFQKLRTQDPATGEVPSEKMWDAIIRTKQIKDDLINSSSLISALTWFERGSNSDVVGPSNGNSRANSGVTSGRIDALWVDIADATGRTVWIGGRGGGLWKTNDITVSNPVWTVVNDYMSNLSVMAITQDPTNTDIMYFCTGESFFEAGALRGNGVFKSTDHGVTWTQLASTNNSTYHYSTRILCDYQGNIYVGTRSGLFRSTKASGGAAWTDITPSGVSVRVSDLEISSTSVAGRLHAAFGFASGQPHNTRYTDIPLTVAAGTWNSPATAMPSTLRRCEMAVNGNTLYALPSNSSNQTPTIYKSTDGGANWAATAGAAPLTATGTQFANGQGWYNLTVAINPSDANQCIIGGIDNAKTTDGGATWTRISNWVFTSGQYVHADQHSSAWYDNGNKLLLGCDGGIFYSSDGGTTIRDRNVGLRLKQFYACDIHPSTTNYFIAGAQDNGTHQFNNAGLSSSVEVFGGDGAYVAIDKDQPQYQTGAYVYSNYWRSSNTGASWTSGPQDNTGQFINPYAYDNAGNKVYACYSAGTYNRWENPQSGFTFTSVPMAAFGGQLVGSVCVSPYTANRVYFGMASGGKIIRVDGADGASPTGVDITGGSMPTGGVYMNCINTGSSDQYLVASYTNYGTSSIWVTTNGGTSWTAVEGNLPDLPVYWAMFHPDDNGKMFIATETGIWETDLLNGASTVWVPNTSFPTVRTTMLKYRSSDRTVLASSYGRGLWTSVIPSVSTPDVQFASLTASASEATAFNSGCRGYTDYSSTMQILNPPTGNATVTLTVALGATATAGVDYIVTSNGNFASPSMVLNFASGSTTPQPFSIRVFNDAAVESAESFTLQYAISGATNAQAGSSNQTHTFTINSDDAGPLVSSNQSGSIGTYDINLYHPFRGSNFDARTQMLYTAAELTGLGFTTGNITSIGFNVISKGSSQPYNGFTIKLKNTATTVLSGGAFEGGTTTVYSSNYSTVSGVNTIPITPFLWDGTSNLLIEMCYDNTSATGDDNIAGATSTANTFYSRESTNATPGCSIPNIAFSFGTSSRPIFTFNITTAGSQVSTALSSSNTAYLGPYDDVYFYDGSGNIMARIQNLGAFDYGCTQVVIDRAGSATAPFWNNNPANYLASKSFRVIPTNNTATGNYRVSFYYTATEINNWATATGQAFASAQVVKVSNGFYIPDVTPASTHATDILLSPNAAGTFGTNYIATGDFTNTGFSGFGIGVTGTALPITINYLNGTKQATGHLLNWKVNCNTSDRATMILERSNSNGTFASINSITADALRCLQPFDFTDKNPLPGINYYRLKVIDIDGKITYSSTVALLNAVTGFEITGMAPNPVTQGYFKLNIASAQVLKLKLLITNSRGRLVHTQQLTVTAGANSIPVDIAGLAAGNYNIQVHIDGSRPQTIRFIKQ